MLSALCDPHPALQLLLAVDVPATITVLAEATAGWDAVETDLRAAAGKPTTALESVLVATQVGKEWCLSEGMVLSEGFGEKVEEVEERAGQETPQYSFKGSKGRQLLPLATSCCPLLPPDSRCYHLRTPHYALTTPYPFTTLSLPPTTLLTARY